MSEHPTTSPVDETAAAVRETLDRLRVTGERVDCTGTMPRRVSVPVNEIVAALTPLIVKAHAEALLAAARVARAHRERPGDRTDHVADILDERATAVRIDASLAACCDGCRTVGYCYRDPEDQR